jgi:hypothetical protein
VSAKHIVHIRKVKAGGTEKPRMTQDHAELAERIWEIAKGESYSDEIEQYGAKAEEIVALVRSLVSGELALVRREELEEVARIALTLGDGTGEHSPYFAKLYGVIKHRWLSPSTPSSRTDGGKEPRLQEGAQPEPRCSTCGNLRANSGVCSNAFHIEPHHIEQPRFIPIGENPELDRAEFSRLLHTLSETRSALSASEARRTELERARRTSDKLRAAISTLPPTTEGLAASQTEEPT